jgi:hypothetical protein
MELKTNNYCSGKGQQQFNMLTGLRNKSETH